MKSISIATLNIGAASKGRARRILDDWVLRSDFDVYVFTESSEGEGTDLIVSAFSDVGWSVLRRNTELGDRGTTVASRIRARDAKSYPSDDPAPGRAVVIELETDPKVELIAMYVPNRGNEPSKTDRKKSYLDSWLKYLSIAPHIHHRILIGDLNVVPTEQKPTFLPQQRFEYDWYSKISRDCGLYDAAVEHNNAGHENTWVAHMARGILTTIF